MKFRGAINLFPTFCPVGGALRSRHMDAHPCTDMISLLPLFPCPCGAPPFPCVSRKCVVNSPADSSPSPPRCLPLLHLMNILQASGDIPPHPPLPLLSSPLILFPDASFSQYLSPPERGAPLRGHLMRPRAEQGEP